MYQVLYRKWRPQTFSDVCGQQHITATLKNELKSGRLSHAYLFTGSRGTGKTSCAKILAKAVNCLHPVDGDPCNACEICKGIDEGTVLDIEEIDAASNNGVDNIRSLREEVQFTPTVGRYRVYIIDEVHMLSTGAFNALLKTLEEPPEHVIFILATTDVHKVPATVLSRCQRFDFHRIANEDIAARLQYVAGQEGFALSDDAAALIARLADGGMRDALSVLDRCAGVDAIDAQRVRQVVGLAGNDSLFALADAMAARQIAQVLTVLDALHQQSRDMNRLNDQLIAHFRDLMLAKAVPDPARLLAGTPEDARRIMNQAEQFTLQDILSVLTALQTAAERMRNTGDRRVELEMALIGLLSRPETDGGQRPSSRPQTQTQTPRASAEPANRKPAPPPDLPWRTDEEEEALRKSEAAAEKYRADLPPLAPAEEEPPAEEPSAEETPVEESAAEQPARQPQAAPPSAEGLPFFTPWPEVLTRLEGSNRLMAAVLKGSDAYIKENIVLIRSDHPQFAQLLNKLQNRNALREAMEQVTGSTYRLGPYKPEEARTAPAPDGLQSLLQRVGDQVPLHNMDEASSQQKG